MKDYLFTIIYTGNGANQHFKYEVFADDMQEALEKFYNEPLAKLNGLKIVEIKQKAVFENSTVTDIIDIIKSNIDTQKRMYKRAKETANKALESMDMDRYDFAIQDKLIWAQRKDVLEYVLDEIVRKVVN